MIYAIRSPDAFTIQQIVMMEMPAPWIYAEIAVATITIIITSPVAITHQSVVMTSIPAPMTYAALLTDVIIFL